MLVQIIFHLIFLDNISYFICMAYEESLMSIVHFHCYHHSMAWVHYCGAIWGPKGLKSLKFWSCLYFYMTFFFLSLFQEVREPNIGTKPRIIILLILTSLKEHPPNPTILFSLRIGSGSRLWELNIKQIIILWTSFTFIILPKHIRFSSKSQ